MPSPSPSSPFSNLVSTLFQQMPSAGSFAPATVNASAHVQTISSDGDGEGKSEDGPGTGEPKGPPRHDAEDRIMSEIEDVEDENEWSDGESSYIRPEESEVAPPPASRRRPRTFREREDAQRDIGDRGKEGEKKEEGVDEEEVRRYKLRAVLLQDELFRTRQVRHRTSALSFALLTHPLSLAELSGILLVVVCSCCRRAVRVRRPCRGR